MFRTDRLLSHSAYLTAQAWVHEGFPEADLFDTLPGRVSFGTAHWIASRLTRRAPSLAWHEQFLLIRHYALDARIAELAPTYVLEAGAGLSPRGIAFARARPTTTYVEVDLPHIVRRKRRHLRGKGAPSNYHLVEGDLADPRLADGLPRLPGPQDHVTIVTEGVLDYLPLHERESAVSGFSRLLAGVAQGCHLFDAYTLERLAQYRVSSSTVLGLMSLISGRRFDKHLHDDAEAAMAFSRRCGFDDVRTLDVMQLNTSPYSPPVSHCPFELVEARVHATSFPSTT